jgi:hypothetical protein
MNHRQVKYVTFIFITSPKKDVTKSTNNSTIALFPHANKIILRFIQVKLELYIGYETPKEQAGLIKGHGERDQTAIVSESWTAQRSTTKMSTSLIHYINDFDCVQHLICGTA